MSDEVFSIINKSSLNIQKNNQTSVKKLGWLIFYINKKLFALPSSSVKEILRDSQVFSMPFVPGYMDGILNRYGDPYAVIDPAVLIGEKQQTAAMFIVINDSSHTCFRITDVKEFHAAPESEIRRFTDAEISDFFEGSLNHQGEEIFILKTSSFIEKMEKDFESA